jgi:hypothetical protein
MRNMVLPQSKRLVVMICADIAICRIAGKLGSPDRQLLIAQRPKRPFVHVFPSRQLPLNSGRCAFWCVGGLTPSRRDLYSCVSLDVTLGDEPACYYDRDYQKERPFVGTRNAEMFAERLCSENQHPCGYSERECHRPAFPVDRRVVPQPLVEPDFAFGFHALSLSRKSPTG